MSRGNLSNIALIVVAATTPCNAAASDDCADLALSSGEQTEGDRATLTPEDLLRLRDIGWPASVAPVGAPALTLSPDGRSLAFQIRRVNRTGSDYCLGMFVAPADGRGDAISVDTGGYLIRGTRDHVGNAAFPTGVPKIITPHWSPDGNWIAFLKRMGEYTQVWRARADGSGSIQVTDVGFDIDDIAWSKDGKAIVFTGRPELVREQAAIEDEGRSGFFYDDRFVPKASSRPFVRAPISSAAFAVDLATGATRAATPEEVAIIEPRSRPDFPVAASATARSAEGWLAWTAPKNAKGYTAEMGLFARSAGGVEFRCTATACERVRAIWWDQKRPVLYFMRSEGWAGSQLGLYRWEPGRQGPRRLFATDAMLASCSSLDAKLFCLRETSSHPVTISSLDAHGKVRSLIELNPEILSKNLGKIERLRWRNAFGIETFGDLILPPGVDIGTKLPLVIVQYDSRGFLRGGTGDEYPIQPFAAAGMAVLSFERPRQFQNGETARDGDEYHKRNMENWSDQKSVLSSLETIIDRLTERGVVDPHRVGIAGLSGGTRNIQFALLNSQKFSAAAVSSSFEEPATLIPLAGGGAASYLASGYPDPNDDDHGFWKDYSITRNAARVTAPVLMQLSDDEYLGSLGALQALQKARNASALYVFPGEHHIKWRPPHRLAIYRRNIAWFRYWLLGARDPETMKMLPRYLPGEVRTATQAN